MERSSSSCTRPINPPSALLLRLRAPPTRANLPFPRLLPHPPTRLPSSRCLGQSGAPAAALSTTNEGLVLGLGPAGEWDANEVGSPTVCRFLGDDQERWFLWYHGGDGVGLATSSNGLHWSRQGLVLGRSDDWWAFDTGAVRPGQVLSMSSAKVSSPGAFYWLYYEGRVDRDRSRPGLALSQDGRNWARIEGEHPSNALLEPGEPGDWDAGSVAAPRVVLHGPGNLRMYYHSSDPARIGVARSGDGINWAKAGPVLGPGLAGGFDEGGVARGHAVKRGGGYVMAYEGVGPDGRRSVGLAESRDGLTGWRRLGGGPVLRPAGEGGWDEGGVGSPCLVPMDGDQPWRLYYAGMGRDGGWSGVGMAVADDPDLSSFSRCQRV